MVFPIIGENVLTKLLLNEIHFYIFKCKLPTEFEQSSSSLLITIVSAAF